MVISREVVSWQKGYRLSILSSLLITCVLSESMYRGGPEISILWVSPCLMT